MRVGESWPALLNELYTRSRPFTIACRCAILDAHLHRLAPLAPVGPAAGEAKQLETVRTRTARHERAFFSFVPSTLRSFDKFLYQTLDLYFIN